MSESKHGAYFPQDYSEVRLELVDYLLEREATEPSRRLGLIGAAAVVLHAAIEEWVTAQLKDALQERIMDEGGSHNRSLQEMDLPRRNLEWKINELGRRATSGRWRLARDTPEVKAILTLGIHRNRLVHMDANVIHLPLPGQPGASAPDDRQLYEVSRIRYEIEAKSREDGSTKSLGEGSVVLQDPWRGMPLSVIRKAEAAFRRLRTQYEGRTGDRPGARSLPEGPIWKRSKGP